MSLPETEGVVLTTVIEFLTADFVASFASYPNGKSVMSLEIDEIAPCATLLALPPPDL